MNVEAVVPTVATVNALMIVPVCVHPIVLVPPIQEYYYLLFYSFFNTIYSNIFIMYRSFIWQELCFVYT